ncbi:MAG: response regulator transcription factor [Candidatus Acidiferrales bacterium]
MLVTVLLADDSEIMRRAIRNLLRKASEIRIVGEAATFAETIRMSGELKPHVVIMDVHMPDETVVTPSQLKTCVESLGSQVLAISYSVDDDTATLAASFGAVKLLDKMKLADNLIPAITHCAGGAAKESPLYGA